jgi:hypothetical protein
MEIEIIVSEEGNELMKANCNSWESAEMELGKLQRKFEEEQASAEQLLEED